jgi:hypothetical protein
MSRSLAPQLVTADDIMEFTLGCEPCEDSRRPFIERFLHGGVVSEAWRTSWRSRMAIRLPSFRSVW